MLNVRKNKISRRAFNIFPFLVLSLVFIQNSAFSDTKFKIMDMEPIRLDVKNIIIKDLYSISFQAPFVEHRMRRSPSDGLISWTRTILRPVGSDGVATFSILEASASLSSIDSDFKFLDLFKNKQTTKITIKLLGKLEIEKQGNNQTGYLDIFASSNKTAPESASITQLENIWDNSLNIAIGKFDEEFRKQIQSLSQFLK